MDYTTATAILRRRERPICCVSGHARSCGGSCDYAEAEQTVAEQRAGA